MRRYFIRHDPLSSIPIEPQANPSQYDQYLSVFHGIPAFASSASFASSWPVPNQSAPGCIELHALSGDGSDDGAGEGDDANPLASPRRLMIHERFFEVRSLSKFHPFVRMFGDRRLRCPDKDRAFFGQAFSRLT
jgi:hypothetical protein